MKAVEIYKTKDGQTQIEVKFEEETVWLNQADIVMLFGSSKANISEHIKSVFISGELDPKSTVRKFRTVRREGKRQVTREIDHYNLDLIISVGYRVNTKTGIKFRQWATQRLKDHLVKGYTINEKRLQQVSQNMLQLQETIQLIQQSGSSTELSPAEAKDFWKSLPLILKALSCSIVSTQTSLLKKKLMRISVTKSNTVML